MENLSSLLKPGYWKLGNELLSENVNFFFLARPFFTTQVENLMEATKKLENQRLIINGRN